MPTQACLRPQLLFVLPHITCVCAKASETTAKSSPLHLNGPGPAPSAFLTSDALRSPLRLQGRPAPPRSPHLPWTKEPGTGHHCSGAGLWQSQNTTHFAARGTVSFCSLPASSTKAGKTQPCPHSGAKHMGQQTQSKQHSSTKAPPFFLILLHSSLFFNVLLPCLLSFQDCSEAPSMQEHLQASNAHTHTHALVRCHCPRALAARGASPGPAH